MHETIARLAADIETRITDIRRDIHSHPETKYREHRTAGVVRAFLDEIGVSNAPCTETGVVATIGSGATIGTGSRTVALRSELDALPMPDTSGTEWASENDGVAHACGHDGHVAMLLGAAWVLKQIEEELSGTVKLIWQPAEEGGAGAEKMILAGALKDPAPEAIFALHGWPGMPVGCIGTRSGPAMAAVDDFEITVTGAGAHGAMPHTGVDPITTAARIVDGIQHIRGRMLDPLAPAVITVGTIHGGTAVNVIPDTVVMSGTIRTLDPDTRARVPELVGRMVEQTALASGATATFTQIGGYPPTINDSRATAFARDTAHDVFGEDQVVEIATPVMGGEDFAYYLACIPGSFMRLGVGDRPPLHNGTYDFNDAAITSGIRMHAGLALRFLEQGLPTE
jgi:amidohydrolase